MALKSAAKNKAWRLGVSALCALAVMAPAVACGPFFVEDVFRYRTHPDLPLKKFASGQLGILDKHMARSYLVVGYRYLSDKPLNANEQQRIEELWKSRLNAYQGGSTDALSGWLAERKKVPHATQLTDIDCTRGVGARNNYGGYDNTFQNCTEESFKSAIGTLQAMVAKYGSGSPQVANWLSAQDLVFQHCSDPLRDYKSGKIAPEPAFPTPLSAADALEKANRAYQIACANFYAKNFDQAIIEFKQIAADASSPWHELAPYLVARALVRRANLQTDHNAGVAKDFATAKTELEQITEKSGDSALKSSALKLIEYVQALSDPAGRLAQVANALTEGKDSSTFAEDVSDFTVLYARSYDKDDDDYSDPDSDQESKKPIPPLAQNLAANDMALWIHTLQDHGDAAYQLALSKWQAEHTNAWLIAALSNMPAQSLNEELVQSARKLPATSCAYLSAAYYSCAALLHAKKLSEATTLARTVLANETHLPPSAVNAFKDLELPNVANLNEFLNEAIQLPAGDTDYTGLADMPDDYDKIEKQNGYYHAKPAITTQGGRFLNSLASLAVLQQAAENAAVPADLKLEVAQAAWTRAVVLDNQQAVSALSPVLSTAGPMLKIYIDAYTKATSPEEKKFAAAYMFLKNPGMRPYVTDGAGRHDKISELDDYKDNWWCADFLNEDAQALAQDTPLKPVTVHDFQTTAQKEAAKKELQRIRQMGTGADYILAATIAWARKTPTDPRLPEALYHAVRAPKFSCHGAGTTKLSRAAYDIIHAQYPKSPWTAKTKYWY